MLLSDNESRHQIEVDLEPFKGLLLGIFFITVGASLNMPVVLNNAAWIALGVVFLMAAKAGLGFLAARIFGVPLATAAELGLLLSQAGEFAFVVIGVGTSQKLLSPPLAAGAVAVVALSMMLTPVAALAGRRIARALAPVQHRLRAPGAEARALKDHVVIGGCGRIGRMIAAALEAEGVAYVCLDTDADAVADMRKADKPVFYGDATRTEILERVGAGHARAFVVTIANRLGAERMVSAARRVNRRAFIFARAADAQHAARLVKRGALGVIPETVEASLQLATRVLEGLDLPEEAVSHRISEMRSAEVAKLDELEAGA
jgi:CPA2 family monovalent cation:H+ antiporter-2